jgi:hypothetical protein
MKANDIYSFVLRLFLVVLFFLFLSACCPYRHAATEGRTTDDSVRVEYRERVTIVPDTVYIEIPLQTAERATRDSTSRLENDYAVSVSRIDSAGVLHHELRTKPQTKAVETERTIEYRDSIVYRDKIVKVTETVEKSATPTTWQLVKVFLIILVVTYCVSRLRNG